MEGTPENEVLKLPRRSIRSRLGLQKKGRRSVRRNLAKDFKIEVSPSSRLQNHLKRSKSKARPQKKKSKLQKKLAKHNKINLKKIDHELTLRMNSPDKTVENFGRSVLVLEPESFTYRICLLNNILNVIHMSVIQASIAALPNSPITLLSILIINEVALYLATVVPFVLHFKFVSWIDFISKTTGFLIMTVFYSTCWVIASRSLAGSLKRSRPVDQSLQGFGILLVVLAIVNSYIFLFTKLYLMLAKKVKGCCKKGPSKVKQINELKSKGNLIYYRKEEEKDEEDAPEPSLATFNNDEPQSPIAQENYKFGSLDDQNQNGMTGSPFENFLDIKQRKRLNSSQTHNRRRKRSSNFMAVGSPRHLKTPKKPRLSLSSKKRGPLSRPSSRNDKEIQLDYQKSSFFRTELATPRSNRTGHSSIGMEE